MWGKPPPHPCTPSSPAFPSLVLRGCPHPPSSPLERPALPPAHSLLPHRWLLTPPEYAAYEVFHILDSALNLVAQDRTGQLKYHWAETAWLPMWLETGNADAKLALLQRLLQSGQLEILGGAIPLPLPTVTVRERERMCVLLALCVSLQALVCECVNVCVCVFGYVCTAMSP